MSMNWRWVLLLVALVNVPVRSEEVRTRMFSLDGHGLASTWFYPDDEIRRVTAVPDVVTPHIVWARQWHGGPVRVLALAYKSDGRWPVELAQRFGFDVKVVYGQLPNSIGAPEREGLFVQGQHDVEARMLQAMNEPVDVVISSFRPNVLGGAICARLKELMGRGVGYVGPIDGLPQEGYQTDGEAARDMLAAAAPAGSIQQRGKQLGLQMREGSGRVADISGYGRSNALETADPTRLLHVHMPDMADEAWCALAGRAAMWAAGRTEAGSALAVRWPQEPIERRAMPNALPVVVPAGQSLVVRVWDADARLRWRGEAAEIPPLPAGRYFAGLQLLVGDAVADWSFTTFAVRAPIEISSIELDSRYKKPGQEVAATVKLSADPPQGMTVRVEVIDNFGRYVSRTDLPAAKELVATSEFAESLHIYNYLNVTLIDTDGQVVDEDRRSFFVARPGSPSDDVVMMLWVGGPGDRVRKQFARLGMNAVQTGPAEERNLANYRSAAIVNAHPVLYTYSRHGPLNLNERGEARPCLSSPKHRAGAAAKLKAGVKRTMGYSPQFYYLGDDVSYVRYGQDACWSRSCRALLADLVQRKYETVDALNEAWGASYTGFEQVEPIKRGEVLAAAREGDYQKLCHWLDHQASTDAMFASLFHELGAVVRDAAPGVPSNMNGDGWPWPGAGMNHWLLAQDKGVTIQYPNLMVHEIFRCAAAPDALRGAWYGGYGVYNYRPYHVQGFLSWWFAFHRVNLHAIFTGGDVRKYGHPVLAADLGPVDGFARILDDLEELRGGVSKLLSHADYQNDGVAIVYSPESLHASLIFETGLPKAAEWATPITGGDRFIYMQSWEGLSHLLRDIGFSFDVLPSSQLVDGASLRKRFRVLALPHVLCLTDAQAEAVRQFVNEGGVVVTDAMAGLFDGRARTDHGGMLADVLGVKQADGVAGAGLQMQSAIGADGGAFGRLVVDTGVSLDGAAAHGRATDGAPVLLTHEYGKGRAITLNVMIRDYQVWRTLATEMPFRDAIAGLLATQADIRPVIACDVSSRHDEKPHRIRVTDVYRYKLDGGEYVGLLRHVRLRPDEEVPMADLRPKPAWITFERKAHVYDVRRRMYRGFADKIEDVIYPGDAELYALLPYEVRDMSVTATWEGRAIHLTAQIVPGGADAEPITHVFHVEIVDPTGRRRPELARNIVARNGRMDREKFFVGYNAPKGEWRLKVRDVASGTERTIVAAAPPAPTRTDN